MKTKIHPQVYSDIKVTCSACGNTFVTESTKEHLSVEVCSKCHPFYTGEHRFLDVKGRVETFKKKQEFAKKYSANNQSKKDKRQVKEEKKIKSLRELLGEN